MKAIYVITALLISFTSVKAQYVKIWQHQYKRDHVWPSLIICSKYEDVKTLIDTTKIADRITKTLVIVNENEYQLFENFMKESAPKVKNRHIDYSFMVTIAFKNDIYTVYSVSHELYMDFLEKIKVFADKNFNIESKVNFDSYYNLISSILMPKVK